MSAVIAEAVRAAFTDNKAKRLARELKCSLVTAKRISATGYISVRFRETALRILDQEITRNRARLEALHLELRALEHEEMVSRAAHRRASRDRENP